MCSTIIAIISLHENCLPENPRDYPNSVEKEALITQRPLSDRVHFPWLENIAYFLDPMTL